MKGIDTVKSWIGALTEIGLMLLALAIVLAFSSVRASHSLAP